MWKMICDGMGWNARCGEDLLGRNKIVDGRRQCVAYFIDDTTKTGRQSISHLVLLTRILQLR